MIKNAFSIFFAFLVLLTGTQTYAEEDIKKIEIVTTTSQIGDLVQNITGDTANVQFLMGTGIDPHMYHPTRQDVAKLLSADIVIYNGMNLEGKMENLLEEISQKKPSLSVAGILSLDKLNLLSDSEAYDPHIWMDVNNWISAGDAITLFLSEKYPKNAKSYERNYKHYKGLLLGLNEYAEGIIETIPKEKRILVTAHDAFGYLGSAYGIAVMGIQGISTESEAGLTQIETLVDLLVTKEIPAVFIESSVSDHNIKAVIEGAKARGHIVELGGTLYSDAMGEKGTAESTYIGMMVYNLKTISKALGGQTSFGTYEQKVITDANTNIPALKTIREENEQK